MPRNPQPVELQPGEDMVVETFERPRGEVIQVRKGKGRDGKLYIDIRNLYTADDGELRFTKKGVRFNADEKEKLQAALAAL